jgi:hypothetical protein
MLSYPLSQKNLKYLQNATVEYFTCMIDLYGKKTICIQLHSGFKFHNRYIFVSSPVLTEWLIVPTSIIINKIHSMMELFHMNKYSLKLNIECTRGCTTYSMNRSFTENIFYVMIFKLAEKEIDAVKKDIIDLLNKYKLLLQAEYLLPELCKEISSYWIYFIFFDE